MRSICWLLLPIVASSVIWSACKGPCTLENCLPTTVIAFDKRLEGAYTMKVVGPSKTFEASCPFSDLDILCGPEGITLAGTELGTGKVPLKVTVVAGERSLITDQEVVTNRIEDGEECHESCTLRKGKVLIP